MSIIEWLLPNIIDSHTKHGEQFARMFAAPRRPARLGPPMREILSATCTLCTAVSYWHLGSETTSLYMIKIALAGFQRFSASVRSMRINPPEYITDRIDVSNRKAAISQSRFPELNAPVHISILGAMEQIADHVNSKIIPRLVSIDKRQPITYDDVCALNVLRYGLSRLFEQQELLVMDDEEIEHMDTEGKEKKRMMPA